MRGAQGRFQKEWRGRDPRDGPPGGRTPSLSGGIGKRSLGPGVEDPSCWSFSRDLARASYRARIWSFYWSSTDWMRSRLPGVDRPHTSC